MPDEDLDLQGQIERARDRFQRFIEELPLPTPREIVERLGELGYVGQEEGRRAMALMAHRHVRRLKYIHVDEIPRAELPPKENHLLVGPTGSGKTFVVELLFRDILKLPTAQVDLTGFSETGYVGSDVSSILTRLIYASELELLQAQVGVICLDEFDKIASGQNRAVFAGAGTTKDVTGLGVQRELLKLLERGELPVPTQFDHSTYQQKVLMRTDDIAFIACGAFSGLKGLSRSLHGGQGIGFGRGAEDGSGREEIAVRFDPEELEDTSIFHSYGFLPELIGRFTRIVPFMPLGPPELRRILVEQVIPGRRRELELAGVELQVTDEVLDHLVERARRKETGARGLTAALARHLEEAAFEAYSRDDTERVELRLDAGIVRTRLN